MAKIIVENIWAEDLFQWFYDSVANDGGDGAAVIVSGDYKETADQFIEWFKSNYQNDFWHPRDEYDVIVNFHDSNENFMFAGREVELSDKDYTFIVKEDCPFAGAKPTSGKRIKAWQK